MQAETQQVEAGQEFDPHSVEAISSGNWERTLQKFTEDMDPWDIDLVTLADRYTSYIERAEDFDLEVPGRVILVGAILLRMKAEVLRGAEEPAEDGFEEQMEFEEEELVDEAEEGRQLAIPEAVPTPPIKKKGERKVTLDELKQALDKALEIEEERTERTEQRQVEDYGIEVEEKDFTDRLETMYDSLKNYVNGGSGALTFSRLVEQEENQEKIEQFVNLMHLETEERVKCYQEEWLGEIEIELREQDPS
ncbi:MAG: segregation/condensation protein A [Candidatus Nanohaloarchaea archaeon]|nr:segregation/condensation protein A [Candidatus Nanohaloarchaea archaeon]